MLRWKGSPARRPETSRGLAAARGLVFSQRRGGQMELEVLILEDAAGGRVTLGNAEQPVLFTAMATRQLCQES